jgi:hypothetical protein
MRGVERRHAWRRAPPCVASSAAMRGVERRHAWRLAGFEIG